VIDFTNGEINMSCINMLGLQGWELVSFTANPVTKQAVFAFKREILDEVQNKNEVSNLQGKYKIPNDPDSPHNALALKD